MELKKEMNEESCFLNNPFNCDMLHKRSGCMKAEHCKHCNECKKIFLKYQLEHWNDLVEFSPLQVELIKNYSEYEWDSTDEREIQGHLDHWLSCYRFKEIPFDLKHDFWRDFLTSIFDVHSEKILRVTEEKINIG